MFDPDRKNSTQLTVTMALPVVLPVRLLLSEIFFAAVVNIIIVVVIAVTTWLIH